MKNMEKFDEYEDFNQLFICSDVNSNRFQKKFICLKRLQITALSASAFVAIFPWSWVPPVFIFFVFLAALSVVLGWWKKYDQKWYLWRSIAESIKSTSWQYIMQGEKFRPDLPSSKATIEFEKFVMQLIGDFRNEFPLINFSEFAMLEKSPSKVMDEIRNLDLKSRSQFYIEKRINPQKEWYTKKSRSAEVLNDRFMVLAFISFVLAAVSVVLDLMRIPLAELYGTAFGSFFVTVGLSFLTWIQIRNYSNLSISYNYTAIEIEQLRVEFEDEIASCGFDDKKFAELIQNSENAFSREHTSWRARKQQI